MFNDYPMYVGKDGRPISTEEAFAAFEDDDARRIAQDHVNEHYVSTVWLVINHGFGGETIPFETMIFAQHKGKCVLADWQERYSTEEAARSGHSEAVALAKLAPCGAAKKWR